MATPPANTLASKAPRERAGAKLRSSHLGSVAKIDST